MELSTLLLMRQELALTAIILILLVSEIFLSKENKGVVVPLALGLMVLQTILGFIPIDYGNLFGGMFQNSELTHLMKNILNVAVLVLFLQSASWLRKDVLEQGRGTEFYLLILSTLLGMYFMISAGDFLMFFLGLELSSLPLAALAAFDIYKKQSAEAGIKFILSAAMASGVSLFGISMIYGVTGSLYFDEIAAAFSFGGLEVLALVFFFGGLAFKMSLVPFHFWTADVYEGSPIPVTSYLSVVSKGAAVFILTIILFTVMKSMQDVWRDVVYILAILTMTIGNLFALRQKNMKRFLAFSSIAQAGFLLLGIIAANQNGMAVVVYFVLIYVFSNLGAFGVVQAISLNTGKENIDDYEGLYRTNPKLSLVMLLSLFSLAGIPPVAGFFGKFFLFIAAAGEGYYWLVLIAVINVTIALYYYLLVVRAMFLRKNDNAIPLFKSDTLLRVGLVICVLGILVAGLYSPLYEYIFGLSAF
ncbi:MAG: NADH-quinone oxidoreductase subunit N [Bacteroidetes bacterium]|nr:MAG: NADH-quinone oxidoreductase subunit N [Bacteroidota bacterium]